MKNMSLLNELRCVKKMNKVKILSIFLICIIVCSVCICLVYADYVKKSEPTLISVKDERVNDICVVHVSIVNGNKAQAIRIFTYFTYNGPSAELTIPNMGSEIVWMEKGEFRTYTYTYDFGEYTYYKSTKIEVWAAS